MKVGITASIREINEDVAHVNCKVQQKMAVSALMPVAFEAMLKAMKDTNKEAFYTAMMTFIDEEISGDKEHD